jgi:MurNAc alpha-1-phosphate uridylyltransferase
VRVCFSRDGGRQLGTGGALRAALPLLGSPFLVTYGDSYLRCDFLEIFRSFAAMRREAIARPPLGLMTVYENRDRYDASNIVFRDGRIELYDKTTHNPEMRHIDFGLGVLTGEAFEAFVAQDVFDLAQVYQRLLAADRLAGHEIADRFYEVGSHAGIAEFRRVVAAGLSST